MKKNLFALLVIVSISIAANAQTKAPATTENSKTDNDVQVFIGINTGLDYNMNAYKLDKNQNYGYAYYGIIPRYNIGIDFGIQVKRFRPRIEMKFVNLKYGIDWSSSIYNLGTTKTIANVNYFDFNMHFDYLLFNSKKLQLFASPAFKYEFEIGNAISTDSWTGLELHHPTSIAGGALTAILKYNLSDHFGLTLTPEYTMFFHSFASGNNKPYQRFSSTLGFEFKF